MKELNQSQLQQISGGAGPEMFDDLVEALFVVWGVSVVAAVGVGVGITYAGNKIYQNYWLANG